MNNTLILLDWDDTLFPTTWVVKNNLDLNNNDDINRYTYFFSNLDDMISTILSNFIRYGKVVIVTNAMEKWILTSMNAIPKTKKVIQYVDIISARDVYQKIFPQNMGYWKKLIFEQVVLDYFKDVDIENIISVGDADHEFNALIDLYKKFKNKKRILKSIRFLKSPSLKSLIDQLDVLNKSIHKVCTTDKHMDLLFTRI